MSSDGHGSWSNYAEDGSLLEIGVSGVDALYKELKYMVQVLGMTLEEALPYMPVRWQRGWIYWESRELWQRGPMRICCCLIRI